MNENQFRGGWGALKSDDGSKKVQRLALLAGNFPDHLLSEAIEVARLGDVDDSTVIGLSALVAATGKSFNPELGFRSNALFLSCVQYRRADEEKKKARDARWIAPIDALGTIPNEFGHSDEDEAKFADLRRAVEKLSPEDRQLIWLRFWEGLSVPEIQNTKRFKNYKPELIRKRFSRAFQRLKKLLNENVQNN
jgi:hypothetical protein